MTPRPWETRVFGECAFPVSVEDGVTFSCCDRVRIGRQYCKPHMKRMYDKVRGYAAPQRGPLPMRIDRL